MPASADLERLVAPRSIALVGASGRRGSLGEAAARNLLEHSRFDGPVHLVTDRHASVLGRPTLAAVDDLPADVDVAMILLPRELVPDAVATLGRRGTRFAIVFAGGFGEADARGRALEDALRDVAAGSRLRIVGPNSPGIADIRRPLGLTIQPGFKDELRPGPVGLVAQSGGLTRCILQGAHRSVGFTRFFSPGNQCDLEVGDYVAWLAEDDETEVIAVAVESIGSRRRFERAVEVAAKRRKPVVLLKVGRSAAGRAAAASHTGAMVGSRAATEAFARRHGITLVDDVDQLLVAAAHLARPRRSGRGAAVYGLSGGAGVLLADALGDADVPLAALTPATLERLRPVVADHAQPTNPVDVGGPGLTRPAAFADGLATLAADPDVGVVLVTLNAWYAGHTERFVAGCLAAAAGSEVPILPVWMSERPATELDDLDAAGLLAARSVTTAAKVAAALLVSASPATGAMPPSQLVDRVRTLVAELPPGVLLETDAKSLLRAAGVGTTEERVVADVEEALAAAAELGYPVIAKVVSEAALHRAGTGLVTGRLATDEDVVAAWPMLEAAAPDAPHTLLVARFVDDAVEAYVGATVDPEWGPVVSVGLGGSLIELLADASVVPAPATREQIVDALGRTKLASLYRRRFPSGTALESLADTALAVAALVARPSPIVELDANPVLLTADGATVADALVVLGPDGPTEQPLVADQKGVARA